MERPFARRLRPLAMAVLLLSGSGAVVASSGQQRLLLPEGTVITVRTQSPLSSASVREGDTFRTVVEDSVRVEGYTVIPRGSAIDGVVTLARRAGRQESGVIGVEFTRLTLPNASSVAIEGKLTSTDPSERRQIDAQGDAQVVFVGGRRGAGAAIGAVGGASSTDPLGGVLGALGTLLSKGADVTVPANTQLAVQLQRGIAMRVVGSTTARRSDAFTIYTSTDAIQAAQRALAQKGYYRGAVDGTLNEATQRGLVEFQIDNGIIVTGNLDGRTSDALGLDFTGGAATGGLTADEASLLRRNAQTLAARYRDSIGITQAGRLNPRRFYRPQELELYFALSGFADNASLYEQIVRLSGNVDGVAAAGTALVESAQRVDAAMRGASVPSRIGVGWGDIQQDLAQLDAGYAGGQ